MTRTRAQKLAQAHDALQGANAIRSKRAKLKRALKNGQLGMADILDSDPPPWLAGARVYDFLMAVPRVGKKNADISLWRAGIPSSWCFGQLSKQQREDLVARVDYRKQWRQEAAALLGMGMSAKEVGERVGRAQKTVEQFRRESRDG